MSKEYERATAQYKALAARAIAGDKQAHRDKQKAREEMRHIERAGARDGVLLADGKKVGEADSKKSLQAEYVRKIKKRTDDGTGNETRVLIDGKETTLSAYHRKRFGV